MGETWGNLALGSKQRLVRSLKLPQEQLGANGTGESPGQMGNLPAEVGKQRCGVFLMETLCFLDGKFDSGGDRRL